LLVLIEAEICLHPFRKASVRRVWLNNCTNPTDKVGSLNKRIRHVVKAPLGQMLTAGGRSGVAPLIE